MSACHPDCIIGVGNDHPGYLGYRCLDVNVNTLPFPGEAYPGEADEEPELATGAPSLVGRMLAATRGARTLAEPRDVITGRPLTPPIDYDALAAFIGARLDETEAHHRRFIDPPTPAVPPYDAAHRRALAAVAAHRAIAEASVHLARWDDGLGGEVARGNLRALAAIWSDHPDYRQEWTP